MPKAMILAAGLGTRLLPFTSTQPKALIPLAGKPLIAHVLERMKQYNYKDIIVNIHHHGRKLKDYLISGGFSDINISFSDENENLLDTGGAIRKAEWFFQDGMPFLVHNCDVISLIPLDEMMQFHKSRKVIATLAVSTRNTSRPLAFNHHGNLTGRYNASMPVDIKGLAFSGIYIVDPAIFSLMPAGGIFSIVDTFINVSKSYDVVAYEHDPEIWVDAGSINNFEKAAHLLKNVHL